jgi:hypothetical protein
MHFHFYKTPAIPGILEGISCYVAPTDAEGFSVLDSVSYMVFGVRNTIYDSVIVRVR